MELKIYTIEKDKFAVSVLELISPEFLSMLHQLNFALNIAFQSLIQIECPD